MHGGTASRLVAAGNSNSHGFSIWLKSCLGRLFGPNKQTAVPSVAPQSICQVQVAQLAQQSVLRPSLTDRLRQYAERNQQIGVYTQPFRRFQILPRRHFVTLFGFAVLAPVCRRSIDSNDDDVEIDTLLEKQPSLTWYVKRHMEEFWPPNSKGAFADADRPQCRDLDVANLADVRLLERAYEDTSEGELVYLAQRTMLPLADFDGNSESMATIANQSAIDEDSSVSKEFSVLSDSQQGPPSSIAVTATVAQSLCDGEMEANVRCTDTYGSVTETDGTSSGDEFIVIEETEVPIALDHTHQLVNVLHSESRFGPAVADHDVDSVTDTNVTGFLISKAQPLESCKPKVKMRSGECVASETLNDDSYAVQTDFDRGRLVDTVEEANEATRQRAMMKEQMGRVHQWLHSHSDNTSVDDDTDDENSIDYTMLNKLRSKSRYLVFVCANAAIARKRLYRSHSFAPFGSLFRTSIDGVVSSLLMSHSRPLLLTSLLNFARCSFGSSAHARGSLHADIWMYVRQRPVPFRWFMNELELELSDMPSAASAHWSVRAVDLVMLQLLELAIFLHEHSLVFESRDYEALIAQMQVELDASDDPHVLVPNEVRFRRASDGDEARESLADLLFCFYLNVCEAAAFASRCRTREARASANDASRSFTLQMLQSARAESVEPNLYASTQRLHETLWFRVASGSHDQDEAEDNGELRSWRVAQLCAEWQLEPGATRRHDVESELKRVYVERYTRDGGSVIH